MAYRQEPRLSRSQDRTELTRAIRRGAMNALTTMRGQEAATFRAISRFVRDDVDRHDAILSLRKIPSAYWPGEEAGPLLESIIAYVRQIPIRDRTSPAALDALQLGDALTRLCPPIRREHGARNWPVWVCG